MDVRGLVLVVALTAGACGGSDDVPNAEIQAPHPQLHAAVSAQARPAFVGADAQARAVWQEVRRFYEQNGHQLVWSDGTQPRPLMTALVRAIRAADEEGLDPANYDLEHLAAAHAAFDPARAADLDLAFTYAYLKFGWHLSRGTVRPEDVNRSWRSARAPRDLAGALQAAVAANRIEASLKALAPSAPPYQGLRTQLAQHRALAAKGEPLSGDTALSIADRIALIRLNMNRWRWMPDDFGPRYVFVNIPAFHLDAFENGQIVLDMKVVAGRKEDPTPFLADRMTHIVFSPYWHIPASIAKNEIMPKLERDPDYLERNNIEMVSQPDGSGHARLRQRPGPRNSLGFVKFMFPNNFNVYLHDTPADSLFDRLERDFSHGCVRVERPLDLAKYVLRDQPEWTEARIKSAMHAGVERTVTVKEPIPVYLAYFTAWEDKGTLQIRPDVYGHDRRHPE